MLLSESASELQLIIFMRQTELKTDRDGYYRRNLGFRQNGAGRVSQPKFNLGSVKRVAQERLEKVAAIWRRVELEAAEEEVKAYWRGIDWEIARAVARGQREYRVERKNDDPFHYAFNVEAIARSYPEIRVVPADEEWYRAGKAEEQEKRKDIEVDERTCLRISKYYKDLALETEGNDSKYVDLLGDVTLHQALDAYHEWVGAEKFDKSENAINDTGVTRQNFIRQLKTYLVPDRPLSALTDFATVDALFGVIRKRPTTHRYKKPMVRKSARHLIGEFARFFDWLHKSPEWDWRKPPDFADISHRPIELESDLDAESKDVPTYDVDQLRTLFECATPFERMLLVLGLNCAFGSDQIGRLKIGEIQEKNGRWYIHRIRRKQKVRGIHRLFEVTVAGLQWAIKGRDDQKNAHVLLTKTGHPLWRKTKGGRRCRDIANAWYRLLDRVRDAMEDKKDKDNTGDFPRYGFNTLRDTSANMIRKIAGEEIASAHLTHKHQSGDTNLRRYTNVPWKKVHAAQRKLEKKLAAVFAGVEQPWFDGKGNKGRKVRKKDHKPSAQETADRISVPNDAGDRN